MAKRLTLKQLRFVNEYVSNDGKITATEAAKRAGFSESRATVTASELLNPQKNPEVVRYIDEMKKEMQHDGEKKTAKEKVKDMNMKEDADEIHAHKRVRPVGGRTPRRGGAAP